VTANARLDLRLSVKDRQRIDRAAALAGLPLTTALFLAWFLLLRPVTLGGPVGYVIVAGVSMEPAFHTGDLAVLLGQWGACK
jgi:hypothetical protein